MAVRLLVMFSVMIVELAGMIFGICAVLREYRPYGPDEMGTAGIVAIVAGLLVCWLITIAFFVRKSSRAKARRIIEQANMQAAKILSEATDKSLALCSLDSPRCRQCGNPRTGKFCPRCGAAGA